MNRTALSLAASVLASCVTGCATAPGGIESSVAAATVCVDRNANARCDGDEPRLPAGSFDAPAGTTLLAAVTRG